MIVDFKTNNVADTYRNKFGKCLDEEDFEGAIGVLLDYNEEFGYPDFHLACGMLYLEMSLESEDDEILTKALHEFMMHIRRFPTCQKAYRNLFAAVLLMEDPPPITAMWNWIIASGCDADEVIKDLAKMNVLIFSGREVGMWFSDLFYGEYGDIDPRPTVRYSAAKTENNEENVIKFDTSLIKSNDTNDNAESNCIDDSKKQDDTKRKSKVFKNLTECTKELGDTFKDVSCLSTDENEVGDRATKTVDELSDNGVEKEVCNDSPYFTDDFFDILDELLVKNNIIHTTKHYDNDKIELFNDDKEKGLESDEGDQRQIVEHNSLEIMDLALKAIDRLDLEEALILLSKIKPDSKFYYDSLNLQVEVYMYLKRYAEAKFVLDAACAIKPHGAYCAIRLCRLYEKTKKTKLIPQVLANIDVKDFEDQSEMFKAHGFAVTYCNEVQLKAFLKKCIDEYNLLSMRLLYAILRYNGGEREAATEEFRKLHRICYNDFYYLYFYVCAMNGDDEIDYDLVPPPAALHGNMEYFFHLSDENNIDNVDVNTPEFQILLVLFLSLEINFNKNAMVAFFNVIRLLACDQRLGDVMRDALLLTSRSIERITQAITLAELMLSNPDETFLYFASCPSRCKFSAFEKFTSDRASAFVYAFTLFYGKFFNVDVSHVAEYAKKINGITSKMNIDDEQAFTYFIMKKLFGNKLNSVEKCIPFALGYKSKAAAERAFEQFNEQFNLLQDKQ